MSQQSSDVDETGKSNKVHPVTNKGDDQNQQAQYQPQQMVQQRAIGAVERHCGKDSDSDEEWHNYRGKNGEKVESSTKLNYQKMIEVMDQKHFRQQKEDGSLGKVPFCKTYMGAFSINPKWRKPYTSNMGEGIVMYFMMLKWLAWQFFVLTLINLPAFYYFNESKGASEGVSGLGTIAFKLSIGNLGSNVVECYETDFYDTYSLYVEGDQDDITVSSSLYCSSGTFQQIELVGVVDESSLELGDLNVCDLEDDLEYSPSSCNTNDESYDSTSIEYINEQFQDQCFGESTCTLEIDLLQTLSSDCLDNEFTSDHKLIVQAQCGFDSVEQYNGTYVSKSSIAMICVIADLIAMFYLFFQLILVKWQQDQVAKQVDYDLTTANDFTVAIKYFEPEFRTGGVAEMLMLKGNLWHWAENILHANQAQPLNPDGSINLDDLPNYVMNIYIGTDNLDDINIKKKMVKLLKEKKVNENKYKRFNKNEQKYKDLKKKINEQSQKHAKKIDEIQAKTKGKAVVAFIQFISMNGKKKFEIEMSRSYLYRVFAELYACFDRSYSYKFINGYWPVIHSAPEPTLIKWDNLAFTKFGRFLRRLIVYLIILIIFSIGSAGLTYFEKLNEKESESVIDYATYCDNVYTQDEALDFYNEGDADPMNCYCWQEFNSQETPLQDIEFADGEFYCKEWRNDFLLRQGIVLGLSLVVLAIASILELFITLVVPFEKNQFISEDLASIALQTGIVRAIAAAFYLIVLYMKLDVAEIVKNLGLFDGSVEGFNEEWYSLIGTVITIQVIYQVILCPGYPIGDAALSFVFACMNRKCRCSRKSTSSLVQKDYEEANMGPEFPYANRVGQLISNLIIIFSLSSGMPLLYPLGFLLVVIQFFSDKYFFFRLYRKPPLYDGQIAEIIPKFMYFSLIVHAFFGLFMFSDESIFGQQSSESVLDQANVLLEEDVGISLGRFSKPHQILYLAGSLLLLVLMILDYFLGLISKLMQLICCCCYKEIDESAMAVSHSTNIYKEIAASDLNKEYNKLQEDSDMATLYRASNAMTVDQAGYLDALNLLVQRNQNVILQSLWSFTNSQGQFNGTPQDLFDMYFQYLRQNKYNHRLRSIYCYDLRENPEFPDIKKIDDKIKNFKFG